MKEKEQTILCRRGERKASVRRNIRNIAIRGLKEKDFPTILALEKLVYRGHDYIIDGAGMLTAIKEHNGFKYSLVYTAGEVEARRKGGILGYLIALEIWPNEVYLQDFAVIPSLQKCGVGWELFQLFATLLRANARVNGESIMLGMHLRAETSAHFMEKHALALNEFGVILRERADLFNHYCVGKDAEYHRYEVLASAAM